MNHKILALLLPVLLQGCVSYKPANLADAPAFVAVAQSSQMQSRSIELDITEVTTLAVLNNPDLRISRAALRVSAAQSFSAGLLPDPQVTLTHDFPAAMVSGSSTAFFAGISYSINALMTHSTLREAGSAEDRQSELALAWQEWQVIAQARLVFVRLAAARSRKDLLLQTRAVLSERYERIQIALSSGLMSLDAVTPHLTALQDLDKQLADLERQTQQATFELKALLGVSPETSLSVRGVPELPEFETTAIHRRLPTILDARPDIEALRAGYAAQDARYRAALLGQFPALSLGVQRARDTSNAYTRGFAVNLTLPIFNGNRGEIRIQEATRDKLVIEYQQRLNAGTIEVHRLLDAQRISQRQLVDIDAALVMLHSALERLQVALAAHNVDGVALASLETSTLAKENERLDALQAIQEQRVALLAVIGTPTSMPPRPPVGSSGAPAS